MYSGQDTTNTMAADEESQKATARSWIRQDTSQYSKNGNGTTGVGDLWIKLMTSARWYPKDMPDEEKRLILKLDLSILVFGCLSFFTKYLDQQSITNAYVRYVSTLFRPS